MIMTLLIKTFSALISFMAWLLPGWKLPEYLIEVFVEFIGFILIWRTTLPVETILTCLSIIIGFELALLSTRLILGLFSLLRGGGEIKI